MDTKHTPGPWAVADGHYPCLRGVVGASFKISAVMLASDLTEDDYLRRSADLKLIAAAPLLLDALQYCLSVLHNIDLDLSTGYCCCGSKVDTHWMGDGHSPVDEGLHHQHAAIDAARAAIAAATN